MSGRPSSRIAPVWMSQTATSNLRATPSGSCAAAGRRRRPGAACRPRGRRARTRAPRPGTRSAASLGARRAPAIRPWLSVAGQNGRIEVVVSLDSHGLSPNAESCRILHFSALAETLPDWDSLCNNEIAGPRVAGCEPRHAVQGRPSPRHAVQGREPVPAVVPADESTTEARPRHAPICRRARSAVIRSSLRSLIPCRFPF